MATGPAWILGGDDRGSVFADLRQDAHDAPWRWTRSEPSGSLAGTPREITLRSRSEGWAFGSLEGAEGLASAALWLLAPRGAGGPAATPSWGSEPGRLFSGQKVVDAYQERSEDLAYLALSPEGLGQPVVQRLGTPEIPSAGASGRYNDWRPAACWGTGAPEGVGADPAHRAFAPIDREWGLLAYGTKYGSSP